MSHSLTGLLTRLDRWPRRLAACLCLLLAAGSALASRGASAIARQDTSASVDVVVAAHDLAVGAVLTGRDLITAHWPRVLVPAGAGAEPARLVGRRLAGPLRTREAVTATRLVGAGLMSGLPAGEVAASVLTDAGVASVIHPGDRVDVLARPLHGDDPGIAPTRADPSSSTSAAASQSADPAILVAPAAAVLAVLPAADAAGGAGDAIVLLATDRATALRIVSLQGRLVLAVLGTSP